MGIDNSPYTYRAGDLRQDSIDKANEIYNIIDIKLTIDEWRKLSPENNDSPYWKNKKSQDGHPSSTAYLKFLKENLPEFVTDKSLNELTEYNRMFDNSSQNDQQINFSNTFIKKFNSKTVSVFGW
jgi:hypothetical protein